MRLDLVPIRVTFLLALGCFFLPPCFPQEDVVAGSDLVAALQRHAGEEIWFGAHMSRLSCGFVKYLVTPKGRSVELRTEWRVERPAPAAYVWTTEWDHDGIVLRWKEDGRAGEQEAGGELVRVDGRLQGQWRSRGGEREWEGELALELPAGALPVMAFPLVAPAVAARGSQLRLIEPWTMDLRSPRFDAGARESIGFRGVVREVDRVRLREAVGCNCEYVLTCASYEGRALEFQTNEGEPLVYVRGTEAEARRDLPCEPGHEEVVAAAGEFLHALAAGDSARVLALTDGSGEPRAADRVREWIERFRPVSREDGGFLGSLSASDFAAMLGDARVEDDRAVFEGGFGGLELVRRDAKWLVREWGQGKTPPGRGA